VDELSDVWGNDINRGAGRIAVFVDDDLTGNPEAGGGLEDVHGFGETVGQSDPHVEFDQHLFGRVEIGAGAAVPVIAQLAQRRRVAG